MPTSKNSYFKDYFFFQTSAAFFPLCFVPNLGYGGGWTGGGVILPSPVA